MLVLSLYGLSKGFMNQKCNIYVSYEGICFYLWQAVAERCFSQFVYIATEEIVLERTCGSNITRD